MTSKHVYYFTHSAELHVQQKKNSRVFYCTQQNLVYLDNFF